MANVSIKFNGKEFLLSCEDGQEEHLEELLIQINQKFNNLKNDLGNLGENKLLLITAVKVMDEYYETKKRVDQKKDELKELSNKFKELKSLIYEYRDRKEEEINEFEVASNNKNFENMEDEIGDIIFTCLNLCRFNKINPDIALARSVKKFQNRSQKFFEILDKENIDTNKAWNKAKLITNESTK